MESFESSANSEKLGFNEIYHLDAKTPYRGNAERVIFVSADNEIPMAEEERARNMSDKKVDLVVCVGGVGTRQKEIDQLESEGRAMTFIVSKPSKHDITAEASGIEGD